MILKNGVLRVGTAGDYRPMSWRDPATGEYWGFDACLAEDLAARLGAKLEYVETSWRTLIEDALAGAFDLALCGIAVTEERKEKALMSDGYLSTGKTVLRRAEDADEYTGLDAMDRPEVRVMENPGGTNEAFVREKLPNATLVIHGVNGEIPGLIASGEADVMITDTVEAAYYASRDSRLAAPLIKEPFDRGEFAVLLPKGSEDLLAYVNGFIEEEKTSGRIDELTREYIYGGPAGTGLEIRKCREEDIPEAGRFYDRVVEWLDGHINYPKWTYKEYPSETSVRNQTRDGGQYLCLEDGKIVGAFVLNDDPEGSYWKGRWERELPEGSYLVVHALAVDPERQREGIASQIVRYCIGRARAGGYQAVRLDIVPGNDPAMALYEKHGFRYAGDADLDRGIEHIPVFSLFELNLEQRERGEENDLDHHSP